MSSICSCGSLRNRANRRVLRDCGKIVALLQLNSLLIYLCLNMDKEMIGWVVVRIAVAAAFCGAVAAVFMCMQLMKEMGDFCVLEARLWRATVAHYDAHPDEELDPYELNQLLRDKRADAYLRKLYRKPPVTEIKSIYV